MLHMLIYCVRVTFVDLLCLGLWSTYVIYCIGLTNVDMYQITFVTNLIYLHMYDITHDKLIYVLEVILG